MTTTPIEIQFQVEVRSYGRVVAVLGTRGGKRRAVEKDVDPVTPEARAAAVEDCKAELRRWFSEGIAS